MEELSNEWFRRMDEVLKTMDWLILRTPMGEVRGDLTDANIRLLFALDGANKK